MREPALTVTIADCDVQTFRAGGKGGQNQNTRDTGARVVHRPSGATGESREHRTQLLNKRAAFRRMGESRAFSAWARGVLLPDDVPAPGSAERVRTYNVADRWVKDHRTGRRTSDVRGVLDGDLDLVR